MRQRCSVANCTSVYKEAVDGMDIQCEKHNIASLYPSRHNPTIPLNGGMAGSLTGIIKLWTVKRKKDGYFSLRMNIIVRDCLYFPPEIRKSLLLIIARNNN